MSDAVFPRRRGRYVLLKELGRGAMGETFLAVSGDASVERLCVLKIGLPGLSAPNARRFEGEARILAQLFLSNIVGLYEVGEDEGQRFIAMEFVHGRTIEQALAACRAKKIAVPLKIALLIARDLARALHYLHTSPLKVLHRDVAAANVMLGFNGDVKLIDFGLAKSTLAGDMTAPGLPAGHAAYIAPERLSARPADGRADIFSLGVLLWELLVGESANSLPGWDEGKATTMPLPPPSTLRPELDPAIDKLVLQATAIKPDARFADADVFRTAIVADLAGRSAGGADVELTPFLLSVFGEEIDSERAEMAKLLASARAPADPNASAAPAGPNTTDPRIGKTLAGRYRLDTRAGEGGMGIVYAAKHLAIDRRVAIKILRDTFAGQPDAIERFKREMRAIGRIEHPNVVAITDSGLTDERAPFYVMEFVDGESLRQTLGRRTTFPIDEALEIAQEIAAGVEGAHTLGIIHRDLKPSNVMLCDPAAAKSAVRAKVLDFGVAKDLRSPNATLTRLDRTVGSPDYMAPEQAERNDVDFRCDIYALGAILFEMLCGRPPFVDFSQAVVLERKRREDPPAPSSLRPDVPPTVDRLVLSALARSPNDRPRSMKDMQTALAAALAARRKATDAPVTIQLPRAPFQSRRVRSRAIVVGGGVALAVVALVGLRLSLGRHDSVGLEPGAATSPGAIDRLPTAQPPTPVAIAGEPDPPPVVPAKPSTPTENGPPNSTHSLTATTPEHGVAPDQPAPHANHSSTAISKSTRSREPALARAAGPRLDKGSDMAPAVSVPRTPSASSSPPASSTGADALARARAALSNGNFVSAAVSAEAALSNAGPEVESRVVLARALFKLARDREAEQQYRRVLVIDPRNRDAQDGLAALEARRAARQE